MAYQLEPGNAMVWVMMAKANETSEFSLAPGCPDAKELPIRKANIEQSTAFVQQTQKPTMRDAHCGSADIAGIHGLPVRPGNENVDHSKIRGSLEGCATLRYPR